MCVFLRVWVRVWLCVGATWVRARVWVGACVGASVYVCARLCVGG